MQKNLTNILNDWFYRLPNGYATEPYNDLELQVLEQVLIQQGIDSTPIIQSLRGDIIEPTQLKRPNINATHLKEGLVCVAIQTWSDHKSIIQEISKLLFGEITRIFVAFLK